MNNSEFSLTWRLARNALPLAGLNYRVGQADMPDCARFGSGLEETAEHAFYYCERVRPFWDHVGNNLVKCKYSFNVEKQFYFK